MSLHQRHRSSAGLLLLCGACHSPADTAAVETGPTTETTTTAVPHTILLITIDTLRGDHVGESTPFLRQLASEGLELTDLDTQSWTYPGVGSILTGRHPASWGAESWTFASNADELPFALADDLVTLAQALGEQGWQSALWTSNPIAGEWSGMSRGYDVYTEYLPGGTVAVGAEVAAWLDAHPSGDRFVHVHVNDPHSPYDLTADSCAAEVAALDPDSCRWDFIHSNEDSLFANVDVRDGTFNTESTDYEACRTQIRTAYRCEVVRQDEDLQLMWEAIAATGALDEALTVVATDHGEGLLDPWTNHSFDLRSPALHGWGLLSWPGHLAPGTLDLPVSQEDLVPTINGLLGGALAIETDGIPVTEIPADRIRTAFVFGLLPGTTSNDRIRTAYDASRHYVTNGAGDCWLYDPVGDPGELVNLCDAGETPPARLLDAVAALDVMTQGYGVQQAPP